jgi:hypothetical protein
MLALKLKPSDWLAADNRTFGGMASISSFVSAGQHDKV